MAALRWLFFAIVAITFTAGAQSVKAQQTNPANQTGVLTLPSGSKFKTGIYEMKVVGQLHTSKKLSYFILSGTTCTDCDENISIYIYSPSDGPMTDEGDLQSYPYPGQETDNESGKVDYEGRMFYGNCLPTHPNAVVWFDRTLGDDKKWRDDVLIAEVKNDDLVITQLHSGLPKLSDAQAAVRTGQCHELPGIRTVGEP